MNTEMKNDLVAAWHEIEESITSMEELDNESLIENLDEIKKRLAYALHWIGKYVNEDDVIETI